jgi:hypothetical protein
MGPIYGALVARKVSCEEVGKQHKRSVQYVSEKKHCKYDPLQGEMLNTSVKSRQKTE